MKTPTLVLIALALGIAGTVPAQEPKPAAQRLAIAKTWITIQAWPLEGCVLSGRPLEPGKAKTFKADGRTFKTCCGRCRKKVEKSPQKFAAKLDDAIVSAQSASYPLTTCPISGKKLGAKAKNAVLNNTLVRLCCGGCTEKAEKRSSEIVAKIAAAAHARQAAIYPLESCPVSGETIDPAPPTDVMFGGTLVRLCCEDCIDELKKQPRQYLAQIEKARPSKKAAEEEKKKDGGEDRGDTEAGCGAAQGPACCGLEKKAEGCCGEAKPTAGKGEFH
jgi:hypothetical protein